MSYLKGDLIHLYLPVVQAVLHISAGKVGLGILLSVYVALFLQPYFYVFLQLAHEFAHFSFVQYVPQIPITKMFSK